MRLASGFWSAVGTAIHAVAGADRVECLSPARRDGWVRRTSEHECSAVSDVDGHDVRPAAAAARTRRYPLVLMLEPLFRCNLACAGCGKIQYPAHILRKNLTPSSAWRRSRSAARRWSRSPAASRSCTRTSAGSSKELVAPQQVRLPLHQRHPAEGEARGRVFTPSQVPVVQRPHGRPARGARRGRLPRGRLRPGGGGDPRGACAAASA